MRGLVGWALLVAAGCAAGTAASGDDDDGGSPNGSGGGSEGGGTGGDGAGGGMGAAGGDGASGGEAGASGGMGGSGAHGGESSTGGNGGTGGGGPSCTVFPTSIQCMPGWIVVFVGTTGSNGGHFTYVDGPCLNITDVNCNPTSSVGTSCPVENTMMTVTHAPCDNSPPCSTVIEVTCP
jgi:hypothetical protein